MFLKKNWPLIATGILAIAIYYISLDKDGNNTETSLKYSLFAVIISLLLNLLYKFHILEENLSKPHTTIDRFTNLLSTVPRIESTIDYAHKISQKNDRYNDFFIDTIFEEYNHRLLSTSNDNFICNPQAELTITKKVLECCQSNLKAISFEDEEWWCGNDGILYLDAHEKHIDQKKEKATRIFLISSSNKNKFKSVFKRHKELKIETYILYTDKDGIDDKYLIDFVIYDDYIVRHAKSSGGGGKTATFTSDNVEVSKYSSLFDEILTIAKQKNNAIPS